MILSAIPTASGLEGIFLPQLALFYNCLSHIKDMIFYLLENIKIHFDNKEQEKQFHGKFYFPTYLIKLKTWYLGKIYHLDGYQN